MVFADDKDLQGVNLKVSPTDSHFRPVGRFPVACVLIPPICVSPSVPDTAPTDVGGGGGTKSELVITWEVSHLSYFTVLSSAD